MSPPVAPAPVGAPVSFFTKVARGFMAAVTSPTAVQDEKNLAVFVLIRLLIAAGASDGIVQLVQAATSTH